jgi:RNA polymerase primary sigma factor
VQDMTEWLKDSAGGDGSTIGQYLAEIGAVPLLSAEEEVALARHIEAGRRAQERLDNGCRPGERAGLKEVVANGQSARDHLVLANTRLVVSVAKAYRGRGLSLADLIQEGNAGLLVAVDRFDYQLGNRFSTYATWWIRQAVSRAVVNQGRMIRVPAHRMPEIRALLRASVELRQELGREPTLDELSTTMRMRVRKVKLLLEAARPSVSLDEPVGGDEGGDGLIAFVAGEEPSPPALSEADALREDCAAALRALPPQERDVLRLYYGLGTRALTLDEIGERYGRTRERVRQLRDQALERLRESPAVMRRLAPHMRR